MQPLQVPLGTKVYLGAPANPMEPAIVRSITALVASHPEIIEAHLPQCYIPQCNVGPAQVLVLVFPESVQWEPIVGTIADGISRLLPQGSQDIWPMRLSDTMLQTVRGTECRIFESSAGGAAAAYGQPRSTRKRWKFW